MSALLDEEYLAWLYAQVTSVKATSPSRTYWELFRQLYTTEFVWFIPNDDNRVEDGKDLRYEFLNDNHIEDEDQDWLHIGCSMLEMLIGVSRRAAFEAGGPHRAWFWVLMDNLDLRRYNDANNRHGHCRDEIDEVLNTVIWRLYAWDGRGGLFPLKRATKDQREVEIRYQLSAYVLERD